MLLRVLRLAVPVTALALMSGAACSSNAPASCPEDIPTSGTSCNVPAPSSPTGAAAECGYATETNECGAVNCYCEKGTWTCGPTCALVDANVPDQSAVDGSDATTVDSSLEAAAEPDGGEDGIAPDGGLYDGGCQPLATVPSGEILPYVPPRQVLGACSSAQISGAGSASFVDSCLPSGAASAACVAWQSDGANQTCRQCLFGVDDAGAWTRGGGLLLDSQDTGFIGGNIAGCIALADPVDGPACADALCPVIECETIACNIASCSDSVLYENCLSGAQRGACVTQVGDGGACAADYAEGGVGRTICTTAAAAINAICGTVTTAGGFRSRPHARA
jgi:hypothetical protein